MKSMILTRVDWLPGAKFNYYCIPRLSCIREGRTNCTSYYQYSTKPTCTIKTFNHQTWQSKFKTSIVRNFLFIRNGRKTNLDIPSRLRWLKQRSLTVPIRQITRRFLMLAVSPVLLLPSSCLHWCLCRFVASLCLFDWSYWTRRWYPGSPWYYYPFLRRNNNWACMTRYPYSAVGRN